VAARQRLLAQGRGGAPGKAGWQRVAIKPVVIIYHDHAFKALHQHRPAPPEALHDAGLLLLADASEGALPVSASGTERRGGHLRRLGEPSEAERALAEIARS
jgi:hypothetical protein